MYRLKLLSFYSLVFLFVSACQPELTELATDEESSDNNNIEQILSAHEIAASLQDFLNQQTGEIQGSNFDFPVDGYEVTTNVKGFSFCEPSSLFMDPVAENEPNNIFACENDISVEFDGQNIDGETYWLISYSSFYIGMEGRVKKGLINFTYDAYIIDRAGSVLVKLPSEFIDENSNTQFVNLDRNDIRVYFMPVAPVFTTNKSLINAFVSSDDVILSENTASEVEYVIQSVIAEFMAAQNSVFTAK